LRAQSANAIAVPLLFGFVHTILLLFAVFGSISWAIEFPVAIFFADLGLCFIETVVG